VSYLQNLLNTPSEPVVRTHHSLEGLIQALVPNLQQHAQQPAPTPILESKAEIVEETKNKDIVASTKEYAETILQTPKDKLEIEKINEEIENDLRTAFLNESVTIQEAAEAQHYYKLYRDKDETFECKISVEGTSLVNSSVRLILETDAWNILFFGKIYKDGRCVVPLKKMSVFPEGLIGKARLEVIIDEMMFVPWEETFIVEGAKKVTVEIKPQTKVSVNLKDN
jgi:hypothetical protein